MLENLKSKVEKRELIEKEDRELIEKVNSFIISS